MKKTLITLAELHYELRLIGVDEYQERVNVAIWLSNEAETDDPRLDSPNEEPAEKFEYAETNGEPVVLKNYSEQHKQASEEDDRLYIQCLGIWVFTKADPDCYPSVPHGHFKSQNNRWPKLNPYTGRVFSAKHKEDDSKRLSKRDMKLIWTDERFKSFCREMLVWYQEQFPYYKFSVRHPMRLPRW